MSLRGKVVAITRPAHQADELAEMIRAQGGEPFIAPTIEIRPIRGPAVKRLLYLLMRGEIDYLVFLSQNAAELLADDLVRCSLAQTRVIAIGPKTKAVLERKGIKVYAVPGEYTSEGIIQVLKGEGLRRKLIAIPRTEEAPSKLRHNLSRMGARIFEIPVYRTVFPEGDQRVDKLIDGILSGQVDVVTFTSASSVRNFFEAVSARNCRREVVGSLREKVKVAVIGPATASAFRKYGVKPDVMPRRYTLEDMVSALAGSRRK